MGCSVLKWLIVFQFLTGCPYFLRTSDYRSPNTERFSTYALPFHAVLFIKEQFFLAFHFPKFPTRFRNLRISFLQRALVHFWYEIYHWYDLYTFYPDIYSDIFHPDSYGIDIRFPSAHCKCEAYLEKKLSDFVPIRFTSAQCKPSLCQMQAKL